MVTRQKTTIREISPFFSGVATDLMLNTLGDIFDRCSDNNGNCTMCPLALKCQRLWNKAVVASVMHPERGLSVHDLRILATQFYKLTKGHSAF